MDRGAAMLILLGLLVGLVLFFLALFAVAPIFCSCIISLLYTLYLFIANEAAGIHHAQEFENRFWTVVAVMFSTALFFAKDSPLAFGQWSPSLGFVCVFALGYGMHAWDRYAHRKEMCRSHGLRRGTSAASSLVRLAAAGQLAQLNSCLSDIDQLLIPSTINNFINQRFILKKEREIISIFEEADKKALNYLIAHAKLGLLFYKIKDHRSFHGQHRTEFIELFAVERLSALTVPSRVVVLHALQMMKLPANAKAEYWVRNIILNTHQDDLSELKTLTDAKGDYFSMTKLVFDGIRSETVRQDILKHFRKEAAIQEAHMMMGTKKAKIRGQKAWRKVLSDVDDTLTCSGGSYPAGIDKRYGKKVVYPGALAFYRELDLGSQGPHEWPESSVGNLVFLSARPHIYKDVSEKHNFAKFEKLRMRGRGGMHTVPSLLAGDVASGREYIVTNDMEPLALKKFENFKQYVSVYPEFKHVFICDNGQGDVRAGELMFDAFPKHVEALYIHVVQDILKTHGYDHLAWSRKGLRPCFFRTYPEAALNAVLRKPPLIRVEGLQRICQDAISDFYMIQTKEWPSQKHKADRRAELNQGLWRVNQFLTSSGYETVPFIEAERLWKDGERVRTPYGLAMILSFDPINDMYEVELDWRPLDVQVSESKEREAKETTVESGPILSRGGNAHEVVSTVLETVVESSEETKEEHVENTSRLGSDAAVRTAMVIKLESPDGKAGGIVHDDEGTMLLPPESPGDKPAPLKSLSTVSRDSLEKDPLPLGNALDRRDANGPEVDGFSKIDDFDMSENASPLLSAGERSKKRSACLVWSHPVKAKIQGRLITKFSPPSLPALPKEGRSIFSFWGGAGEGGKQKGEEFKPGDACTTPFGPAKVVEYRKKKNVVVVDMIGWQARSYLRKESVKVLSKSLWDSLFRRLHLVESRESATAKPKPRKELEFPYAAGTTVLTPYGEGVVSRPLTPPISRPHGRRPVPTKAENSISDHDGKKPRALDRTEMATLSIRLTSWKLAGGSSPTLYCTLKDAEEWKKAKEDEATASSLFSVVGSLVSKGLKRMTSQVETIPVRVEPKMPRFERYYRDGASVTTSFGHGSVRNFRETDGIYEISLTDWKLKSGEHPVAFLPRDALSYRLAEGCQEGYPVLTKMGISGTLASVEPTTGVHVVTVPSLSMVCYLQPNEISRPLKAAVGEDVATPYGEGKVVKYRDQDNLYEISLTGSGAMLYAKAETFDRITDGMNDREGPFGVTWLFRYLFFASDDKPSLGRGSRSRSNSISQSIRSHKSETT